MPTPLLSFLDELEEALRKESPDAGGFEWSVTRIVNYQHGLARMTLAPLPDANPTPPRGAIFLQGIPLADGSLCFRANLNWHGSDAFPIITVHSKLRVNWKEEATRIATIWLAGPSSAVGRKTTSRDDTALNAYASV